MFQTRRFFLEFHYISLCKTPKTGFLVSRPILCSPNDAKENYEMALDNGCFNVMVESSRKQMQISDVNQIFKDLTPDLSEILMKEDKSVCEKYSFCYPNHAGYFNFIHSFLISTDSSCWHVLSAE